MISSSTIAPARIVSARRSSTENRRTRSVTESGVSASINWRSRVRESQRNPEAMASVPAPFEASAESATIVPEVPTEKSKPSEATRASVLIDGENYFRALHQAFKKARRSILIVGWDFDGRIKLRPDTGDDCVAVGDFLRSLVESVPELQIHILIWSFATVHAPSAPSELLR